MITVTAWISYCFRIEIMINKKMKNRTILIAAALLSAVSPSEAQNPQKGNYGYLYCHMSDRGEYTAYALSRDGYHYEDVLGGDAIMNPAEHARIEGGQRDAYICRSYDAKGYLMVTTDMCVAKSNVWDNYGIDLLHSKNLVDWTSKTFRAFGAEAPVNS